MASKARRLNEDPASRAWVAVSGLHTLEGVMDTYLELARSVVVPLGAAPQLQCKDCVRNGPFDTIVQSFRH